MENFKTIKKEYEFRTPYSSQAWRTFVEMDVPSTSSVRTEILVSTYLHYLAHYLTIKEVVTVLDEESVEELNEETDLINKNFAHHLIEFKKWLKTKEEKDVETDITVYKDIVSKYKEIRGMDI